MMAIKKPMKTLELHYPVLNNSFYIPYTLAVVYLRVDGNGMGKYLGLAHSLGSEHSKVCLS